MFSRFSSVAGPCFQSSKSCFNDGPDCPSWSQSRQSLAGKERQFPSLAGRAGLRTKRESCSWIPDLPDVQFSAGSGLKKDGLDPLNLNNYWTNSGPSLLDCAVRRPSRRVGKSAFGRGDRALSGTETRASQDDKTGGSGPSCEKPSLSTGRAGRRDIVGSREDATGSKMSCASPLYEAGKRGSGPSDRSCLGQWGIY